MPGTSCVSRPLLQKNGEKKLLLSDPDAFKLKRHVQRCSKALLIAKRITGGLLIDVRECVITGVGAVQQGTGFSRLRPTPGCHFAPVMYPTIVLLAMLQRALLIFPLADPRA